MNPWMTLGNTVGWLLLAAVILFVALVLAGLVLALMRLIHDKLRKRSSEEKRSEFYEQATLQAMVLFKEEQWAAEERVLAFRSGALWAYEQFKK